MKVEQIEASIKAAAQGSISRDELQALLDELAGHVGLEGLNFDSEGVAWLQLDADVPVALIHSH
ncbi:MAG: hypothetical protein AAF637_21500 [Pseudomonadota bacterium]